MPRLDGTGPNGEGPRTGRGMGNCQKPGTTVTNNKSYGRGRPLDGKGPQGKGPRTGRGMGNCPEPENNKEQGSN